MLIWKRPTRIIESKLSSSRVLKISLDLAEAFERQGVESTAAPSLFHDLVMELLHSGFYLDDSYLKILFWKNGSEDPQSLLALKSPTTLELCLYLFYFNKLLCTANTS